ncbi:putative SAM-dependent methyltransferase [Desulfitobacterium dichloroeliminans LMG P-21439]|uniref:Putative SAM-dependent methyltransferase n=1 Tax=Desulfitobacterium dichloroeliminans (strain LMG P-21439 / DCA1) TaxID=871963 RepID=L0F928_DESDL|nr:tRNA (adenine(22)-N(1))-methyltransferase TrmK [Desulfitobacterium dichloroeliminans]AGA70339.1 putative SAM-dependent methyltransferase [Desulfitobacterium dichloroeliminans LMG P-21439]
MTVSVNIGPRLHMVATFVPKGSQLGDIGTDHAYLPIYLWESGRIEKAIAVDVHEGPYRSACAAIKGRGLTSVIDVRYGDGLTPIQPGEVDTLTLAGMGGNTMLEIFAAQGLVMSQVEDLILQPQGAEGKVRLTLLQEGWKMIEERYVAEEGRIYVVMHFSRRVGYTWEELQTKVHTWLGKLLIDVASPESQQDQELSEGLIRKWIWEFGPLGLENPQEELQVLIHEQKQTLQRTIGEMQKSAQTKVQKRIDEYNLSIRVLEGMEKCLFRSV